MSDGNTKVQILMNHFKTVCMTVTHPSLSQANQPLLSDTNLQIIGADAGYLCGMHGSANLLEHRRVISERSAMPQLNRFAEMTFRVPDVPDAPLCCAAGPEAQTFDCKKASKRQVDAFLDLFLMVLLQYYDYAEIQRATGALRYGRARLDRMTVVYTQHLPELMAMTSLKLLIVMISSRHGFERTIAMIARADIQTYVTEICSDPGGRAFAYRLQGTGGVTHHLALPPKIRSTVPHETTKDFRSPRMPRVTMTVVTNARGSQPWESAGLIVELDRVCARAIGSDVDWLIGYTDHREAPNSLSNAGQDDTFRGPAVPTKTLVTLVSREQVWPDCSRTETLASLPFFDPDFASLVNMRTLIASAREEIEQHEGVDPRIAAMTFKDPRRELDELAMSHPDHVLGALEQAGIDVAVLPTRWPDGAVTRMTFVRAHRLQHYLESIDTVGAEGPVRYALRYDADHASPIWIEVPGTQEVTAELPRPFAARSYETDVDFDDDDEIIWGGDACFTS